MYASDNEPLNKEELRAYQAMQKGRNEERREIGQSFTQPPPPTSHEKEDSIPPQSIEDRLHDLTVRFDSFLDEAQEYQVSMTQEMEELKSKVSIV